MAKISQTYPHRARTVVESVWTAGNAAGDHPAGIDRLRFWFVGRHPGGDVQHRIGLPTTFRRR